MKKNTQTTACMGGHKIHVPLFYKVFYPKVNKTLHMTVILRLFYVCLNIPTDIRQCPLQCLNGDQKCYHNIEVPSVLKKVPNTVDVKYCQVFSNTCTLW